MPYLVRVGAIPGNASGVGARGYFVGRNGTKVIVEYGAIGMTRTRPRIFYWAGPSLPQRKVHRFTSVDRARRYVSQLKKEKLRLEPNHQRHNYSRLPAGKIIRSFSIQLVSRS